MSGTAERALIVGEALVDIVRRTDGTVQEHPGGSPANVALGLGRLGRAVDLLTWFGTDVHGDLLRGHLEESGVSILPGSDGALATPVAAATRGSDGGATYDFDLTWELPVGWRDVLDRPLVVHTGSIGAVLSPGGAQVLELVERSRPTSSITYDPNLRPALMGSAAQTEPVVEALVALSDVVKVSDEDLAWLHPGALPADVAADWCRRGPALVVVTLGGAGAFAVTSAGVRVQVAAPAVTVADTVGAGDSFMGGLIDGLWSAGLLGAERRAALHGIDASTLEDVLGRCVRIAAITVSRAGANPPWTSELADR